MPDLKGVCDLCEIVRKDEYEKGLQEGLEKGIEKGIEEGREEGFSAGKADAILELLEDIGTIPEEIRKKIRNEKDIKILNGWLSRRQRQRL